MVGVGGGIAAFKAVQLVRELMRRGAQAVLDAERLAAADRELRAAYRRQPADPALVQSARRLAAETAPAW